MRAEAGDPQSDETAFREQAESSPRHQPADRYSLSSLPFSSCRANLSISFVSKPSRVGGLTTARDGDAFAADFQSSQHTLASARQKPLFTAGV